MGQETIRTQPLKCSGCGADLVKSYRLQYDEEDEENVSVPVAKCVSCGKEFDQHSGEYYKIFADTFTFDKDQSVFKLGIKGTLKEVDFEIIGRLRYQDEEEYDKTTWDEWIAISNDGVYHYFVEEEGEVYSYEEYVPQSIDLESNPGHIEFEGKKIPKSEAYTGRIVYAEGELPWKPEIGEPVLCYDFKKDGAHFTIEHSEDEVSITRGEKISYEAIIGAFGGETEKDLYDKTDRKRKSYRRKALVYLAACFVTFGLAVASCLSGSEVGGVMTESRVITANEYQSEGGNASYFSQVLYGPFRIGKGESLYQVNVSVDQSTEPLRIGWESFRLMMVKEDRLAKVTGSKNDPVSLKNLFGEIDSYGEPVESYAVTGDFWDEEGHDDEGYWHESDLSADETFVLEEPGNYYAYLELYNDHPRRPDAVKIRLERVKSYRYYLIFMSLFLVLMLINRSRAGTYNELPFKVSS